jgi:hypothetical protein
MQSLGSQWTLNQGGMRLALVVSVMTVYLVLVCSVSFSTYVQQTPPLTEALMTHFTTVVLAVVGFYFGASAYVQVHQKDDKPADKEEAKNEPAHT